VRFVTNVVLLGNIDLPGGSFLFTVRGDSLHAGIFLADLGKSGVKSGLGLGEISTLTKLDIENRLETLCRSLTDHELSV